VCVREKRERNRECVCVSNSSLECQRGVCVREREKKRDRECVCVSNNSLTLFSRVSEKSVSGLLLTHLSHTLSRPSATRSRICGLFNNSAGVAWLSMLHMGGWLQSVGSIKLQVSFAEYHLFLQALFQKRPMILSILLTRATP